jgi:hypothetical protein
MFERVLTHSPGDMISFQGRMVLVCANIWSACYTVETSHCVLLIARRSEVSSLTITDRSDTPSDKRQTNLMFCAE